MRRVRWVLTHLTRNEPRLGDLHFVTNLIDQRGGGQPSSTLSGTRSIIGFFQCSSECTAKLVKVHRVIWSELVGANGSQSGQFRPRCQSLGICGRDGTIFRMLQVRTGWHHEDRHVRTLEDRGGHQVRENAARER